MHDLRGFIIVAVVAVAIVVLGSVLPVVPNYNGFILFDVDNTLLCRGAQAGTQLCGGLTTGQVNSGQPRHALDTTGGFSYGCQPSAMLDVEGGSSWEPSSTTPGPGVGTSSHGQEVTDYTSTDKQDAGKYSSRPPVQYNTQTWYDGRCVKKNQHTENTTELSCKVQNPPPGWLPLTGGSPQLVEHTNPAETFTVDQGVVQKTVPFLEMTGRPQTHDDLPLPDKVSVGTLSLATEEDKKETVVFPKGVDQTLVGRMKSIISACRRNNIGIGINTARFRKDVLSQNSYLQLLGFKGEELKDFSEGGSITYNASQGADMYTQAKQKALNMVSIAERYGLAKDRVVLVDDQIINCLAVRGMGFKAYNCSTTLGQTYGWSVDPATGMLAGADKQGNKISSKWFNNGNKKSEYQCGITDDQIAPILSLLGI